MILGNLTTEARNPASEQIDRMNAREIVHLMNSEDATVAEAVGREAGTIARAIEVIAERMRSGGRLIYVGAGTSGRLGVLDASECPPTFNTAPEQVVGLIAGGAAALTRAIEGAEDSSEQGATDAAAIGVSSRDVVVGIATSGRTPYVLGALDFARRQGAFTVGLSCNADSQLTAACELMIAPVVGPEIISGSTRLKAGTATKMVLNMLSTGTMILLGKTFGNLMVDLRATNRKLTDRARRIVSALTGLDEAAALAQLMHCGGDLKTAIVSARCSVSAEEARQRLTAAEGHLRLALGGDRPTVGENSVRELVLGVDGGGTKTVAWLASCSAGGEETVLGRGSAGPANPQAVGFSTATRNLLLAVEAAFAAAKLPRSRVRAACLALAGVDREDERTEIQAWAAGSNLAERLLVVNDALPVLFAGSPQRWGIALIAGTGSLAFGRNQAGETARAGGWGYLFGDEGSAYRLALDGLRAAAQAADGRGPDTRLLLAFLARLELSKPSELVRAIYRAGRDRAAIASLADVVVQTAEAGDAEARRILQQACSDLADLVEAVARQLGLREAAVPLALAGGFLLGAPRLQRELHESLATRSLQLDRISPVPDPVWGAIVLARAELLPAG